MAVGFARRPFDTEHIRLIRACLIQADREDHVLLLTMHHIVSDGWSMSILIRELAALYTAACSGARHRLADLQVQYGDYAAWQRQCVAHSGFAEQLAYWKARLAGCDPSICRRTTRVRPCRRFAAPPGFYPARGHGRNPQELGRREGITLFMSLLAAFQSLLYRYTGQTDLTLGTPVANRDHPAIEGLIGFFANTLALRADLRGNPGPFRSLAQQAKAIVLQAYDHHSVPFEEVVRAVEPERDLSRSPLFSGLVHTALARPE